MRNASSTSSVACPSLEDAARGRYKFAVTGPSALGSVGAAAPSFALQVWAIMIELLAEFKQELESLRAQLATATAGRAGASRGRSAVE